VYDLEWTNEFIVEFHGRASCFDVSAVDHDKGTRGEGGGVVGTSVSVGVLGVSIVGDGNKVGSGFVDGGEVGSVLGGVWDC